MCILKNNIAIFMVTIFYGKIYLWIQILIVIINRNSAYCFINDGLNLKIMCNLVRDV